MELFLEPEPGESTEGEHWLMVMAGLQVAFVWVELEFSAAGRVDVSCGVNNVVGLLAELLVLWKGRDPGLSGMVPTNPVCTLASWVCALFSQHPPWQHLLASSACCSCFSKILFLRSNSCTLARKHLNLRLRVLRTLMLDPKSFLRAMAAGGWCAARC